MIHITPTQLRILSAIQQHTKTHSIPPSMREVAQEASVSLRWARAQIDTLRQANVLVDAPARSARAIAVRDYVQVVALYE